MAVSKYRLVALCASALDYQRGLVTLCQHILDAQRSVQGGAQAQVELQMLAALASPQAVCGQLERSATTLATELQVLAANWGHNERERRRQARRRGLVPPERRPMPQLLKQMLQPELEPVTFVEQFKNATRHGQSEDLAPGLLELVELELAQSAPEGEASRRIVDPEDLF